METSIQIFTYNDQKIEFDLAPNSVMVNATEMAKLFGKYPKDFLILDTTKAFINSCLKKENSPFLSVENEDDIVISKQKSGTWMHRILALKFASWLDPDFELWVYSTIDQILFGKYRMIEESLKESARRKNRMDELKNKLAETDEFRELERLELEEKQATYRRTKENRNQLDLFRTIDQ
jgi:hypothetical protein